MTTPEQDTKYAFILDTARRGVDAATEKSPAFVAAIDQQSASLRRGYSQFGVDLDDEATRRGVICTLDAAMRELVDLFGLNGLNAHPEIWNRFALRLRSVLAIEEHHRSLQEGTQ